MAEPRISVLLPLQEDRATGEASVREWTRGQTAPRDSYEVIVLAPGLDPVLEDRARGLLTDGDRWVEVDTPDEYEMFNVGTGLARGTYVFPTEAHCVPEPDCLAAMLAALEERRLPGARGVSKGVSDGGLARLEKELYDDHLRPGGDDDHWRKVLIHSLAIRKDVLEEVGGFPARYGDFCVWALAISLREAGHRLGFAGGAAVRHIYTGELGILADHVRDFAHGEMRYYSDQPVELIARYLDEAEEWTNRYAYTRRGARAAARAAAAAGVVHPVVAAQAARHAICATVGPWADARLGFAAAGALRACAAASAAVGRPSRGVYQRFWEATARAARREYISSRELPMPAPLRGDVIEIGGVLDGPLIGFHGREEWEGRAFRWTSGLALLELEVPAGRHEICIRLLQVGAPATERRARIVVDGRRLPPAEVEIGADAIRFAVTGPGTRTIGIVSAPVLPWLAGSPDRRPLGLPVTRVEVSRA